jgi:hypothetical protein
LYKFYNGLHFKTDIIKSEIFKLFKDYEYKK